MCAIDSLIPSLPGVMSHPSCTALVSSAAVKE